MEAGDGNVVDNADADANADVAAVEVIASTTTAASNAELPANAEIGTVLGALATASVGMASRRGSDLRLTRTQRVSLTMASGKLCTVGVAVKLAVWSNDRMR